MAPILRSASRRRLLIRSRGRVRRDQLWIEPLCRRQLRLRLRVLAEHAEDQAKIEMRGGVVRIDRDHASIEVSRFLVRTGLRADDREIEDRRSHLWILVDREA